MADMSHITPPSLDPTPTRAISISTQIMIGTILILIIVIAFCFFIHLYAKIYWTNNGEDRSIVLWRRQLAQHRRTTTARLHRNGLDAAALESLPAAPYNPKNFKEELECAVCLSEVSEGENVRILPKCNHGFHVNCIDMWFQSHSTCPLCRNPVISTPITSPNDQTNHNSNEQDDHEIGSFSSDSSDSSSSDDDDDNSDSNRSPRIREVRVVPANVLFWGNETRVNGVNGVEASSSGSSSGINKPGNLEMVIEIPTNHEFFEYCLSSPPLEEKTPVTSRLTSLKRWWSLGKSVASPSPRASSSGDVHHQV